MAQSQVIIEKFSQQLVYSLFWDLARCGSLLDFKEVKSNRTVNTELDGELSVNDLSTLTV